MKSKNRVKLAMMIIASMFLALGCEDSEGKAKPSDPHIAGRQVQTLTAV